MKQNKKLRVVTLSVVAIFIFAMSSVPNVSATGNPLNPDGAAAQKCFVATVKCTATLSTTLSNDMLYVLCVGEGNHSLSVSDSTQQAWNPRASLALDGNLAVTYWAQDLSVVSSDKISCKSSVAEPMTVVIGAISGVNGITEFQGSPVYANCTNGCISTMSINVTTERGYHMVVAAGTVWQNATSWTAGATFFAGNGTKSKVEVLPSGAMEWDKTAGPATNIENFTIGTAPQQWGMIGDVICAAGTTNC